MTRQFTRFAAIDWSGAKGSAHPGIALAVCRPGSDAPQLVAPAGRHWSRQAILDWVLAQRDDILVGFDFSFAPPFVERGGYLPGEALEAWSAFEIWAHVDRICDDDDLGAASLLERHYRRHFYFGSADGRKSDFMHWRQCERRYNATAGGKPSTVFDAIGASQVAKASFAGMRLLHHARGAIRIWPFDTTGEAGPLIVEIYTQIAARAGGLRKGLSKVRDGDGLDSALAALGSGPHTPLPRYSDHATDAILTAAWLRARSGDPALWLPSGLTPAVRQSEGWTFGVE